MGILLEVPAAKRRRELWRIQIFRGTQSHPSRSGAERWFLTFSEPTFGMA